VTVNSKPEQCRGAGGRRGGGACHDRYEMGKMTLCFFSKGTKVDGRRLVGPICRPRKKRPGERRVRTDILSRAFPFYKLQTLNWS
jgi:hypothetical protein